MFLILYSVLKCLLKKKKTQIVRFVISKICSANVNCNRSYVDYIVYCNKHEHSHIYTLIDTNFYNN